MPCEHIPYAKYILSQLSWIHVEANNSTCLSHQVLLIAYRVQWIS